MCITPRTGSRGREGTCLKTRKTGEKTRKFVGQEYQISCPFSRDVINWLVLNSKKRKINYSFVYGTLYTRNMQEGAEKTNKRPERYKLINDRENTR